MPWRTHVAALVLLSAAACQPADRQGTSTPATDTARSVNLAGQETAASVPPTDTARAVPSRPRPPEPTEIPEPLRPVCAFADTVLRDVARQVPGIRDAKVADAKPVLFEYWYVKAFTAGCLVVATGADTSAGHTFEDRVISTYERTGWKQASRYSADGDDSSVIGYERGGSLCLLKWFLPGGGHDDSDTTVDTMALRRPREPIGFEFSVECAPARDDDDWEKQKPAR